MPTPNLPALQAYIESLVGGKFDAEPLVVSVGTSAKALVMGDMERVSLLMRNLGSANVYVNITAKVSAFNGILLAGSGGYVTLNPHDDFVLPGYGWWGVAASGTNNVLTMVVKRYNNG